MNKSRRATIRQLQDRMTALLCAAPAEALRTLQGELEALRSELESVKDSEQEAFDNLPEGLQNGDKGQRMTDAIDALDSADGCIGDVLDALEALDLDVMHSDIHDHLETACFTE